ncbi:amidohydrolase [Nakamurella leprariae]|uniref:Peptidase M20 domain-containing protein 2 n=1 Tax=Nakamurella leprariae TaxID=2803911 RepID=A0A938YDX8_9ACTN|nr:amidohydrolase [Nakamurella leprariae]MBM9468932.1 amidohydrolase [Nakamurella leprariae]
MTGADVRIDAPGALDPADVGTRVEAAVRAVSTDLTMLATALAADPELAFDEHRAAAAATALLEHAGFTVDRGVGGLATAFRATAGSGSLVVAFCAEYDALPEIGHGCGHPLIAGSSLGAAIGLAAVAGQLDVTVQVIGCPAEEHGGGKAVLLERGVFDGVHAALMVHPAPEEFSANPVGTTSQAAGRFRAVFTGQAAHAAAAPHLGRNAMDAATLAGVAIGLLRQQLADGLRVSAYVVSGGAATNIISDRAVVDFECRALLLEDYLELERRVRLCFDAAALATETTVAITETEPRYEPLRQHEGLGALWSSAIGELGHPVHRAPLPGLASTDMGNVSQRIPSLHPWLPLPGVQAVIHSRDFAAQAATPSAHRAMLDAAVALARTAAGAAADPQLRVELQG